MSSITEYLWANSCEMDKRDNIWFPFQPCQLSLLNAICSIFNTQLLTGFHSIEYKQVALQCKLIQARVWPLPSSVGPDPWNLSIPAAPKMKCYIDKTFHRPVTKSAVEQMLPFLTADKAADGRLPLDEISSVRLPAMQPSHVTRRFLPKWTQSEKWTKKN